jgi:hypothetical protein
MAIGHFQFTTLFKNQIKYRNEKETQPLYSSCTLFPFKLQCVIQTHKMFGPRIRKKDKKNQKMCLHNVLSGLCQINPPLEALRILSQSRPDQSPFYIQLAYTCWLNMYVVRTKNQEIYKVISFGLSFPKGQQKYFSNLCPSL